MYRTNFSRLMVALQILGVLMACCFHFFGDFFVDVLAEWPYLAELGTVMIALGYVFEPLFVIEKAFVWLKMGLALIYSVVITIVLLFVPISSLSVLAWVVLCGSVLLRGRYILGRTARYRFFSGVGADDLQRQLRQEMLTNPEPGESVTQSRMFGWELKSYKLVSPYVVWLWVRKYSDETKTQWKVTVVPE